MLKNSDLKVYLAGPMRGCTKKEMTEWREWFSERLNKRFPGIVIFDPVKTEHPFNQIVRRDLLCLRRSDVVIVNYTKSSSGTMGEMVSCRHYGVPTVTWVHYEDPWVYEFSPIRFDNKRDVLKTVIRMLDARKKCDFRAGRLVV